MSRYIYESRSVGKGRKTKFCASCNKTINIGEPSITITCFSDEFYAEDVCSTECENQFGIDFDKETERMDNENEDDEDED